MAASKPELLRFAYDGFKTKSDEARKITQVSVDSHGNLWQLTLYPDYPTVALANRGKHGVDVTVSLILRDAKGHVAHEQRCGLAHFEGGKSHSFLYLVEWSKIINSEDDILKGEDLIIEAEMYRVDKATPALLHNPFGQNILKLLGNRDTADVSFNVQNIHMFAHRILLQANAPVLASFCEQSDRNTPVPIHDVSPTVFRHVLRYVYSGEEPNQDFIQKQGIELLGAANRYGVVGLKLAVESIIVKSGMVHISNVIEFMLFADATTSPLLKEYTVSYFLARARDILRTASASKLKESGKIGFELIDAMFKSEETTCESENGDFMSLSIEQLRRKLFKKGILDLDGSKNMLVARLRKQRIIERGCSTV